ncbi:MAG TPA: RES family NAD+ phosphorylase [Terriglobia bacterium]|nr:RES family NAD+ phosphorylase [Terriglobia bacterium]
MTPKLTALRQDNTHRLIPSRYGEESVLGRLAEDNRDLQALFELEGATNDRLLGEANLLPGISVHELLFGVSYAHIVNAAFTHAHPSGSRFNGPGRGAWYAAFELKTAQAETVFHKAQELAEIGWRAPEVFSFRDYLADFRAEFHDIRGDTDYAGCLDPASYANSQSIARELLALGSAGIVYPSVRRAGGNCVACFRPALVANVRQGRTVMIAFRDPKTPPTVSVLREAERG